MSITKQLLPVPFTGAIDGSTDPKQLLPGNLLNLQNAQFGRQGELNKRFGYTTLSQQVNGGGSITNGAALCSYEDELILFDNTNIYSYVPSTMNWLNRGTAISIIATDKQIVRRSDAQQLNPDIGYLNGLEVYAWEDSRGGVRYSAVDSLSHTFVVGDQVVNASSNIVKPKVIAFNGLLYIFYSDNVSNILYRTLNPANATVLGPETVLRSDGYAQFGYDIMTMGGLLYVAYLSSSVVSGAIKFFAVDGYGSVGPITTVDSVHAYNSASAVNIVADAQQDIWISWSTGTQVRTSAYRASLTNILASTLVDTVAAPTLTGVGTVTAGTLQLTYEIVNADATKEHIKSATITTAGIVTTIGSLLSVGLASKAFTYNTHTFINVTHQSTLQSTYFTYLIDSAPFVCVGKIAAQNGGGLRSNNILSEIPPVPSDTIIFIWANLTKGQIISEASTVFTILGVNGTTLDFLHPNHFQTVVQSRNLLISGAILQCYDGLSVVELGYHLFPENVTANSTGSDGYLSTGTYQYQVCYEWLDNFGQWQRSAPSPAVTVSVTATNHVVLSGPMLRLTAKQNTRANVNIVIYRTAANQVNFNQITSVLAPLVNDPTTDTWTFTDFASDNDIVADALIYTTGGTLDNAGPPANTVINLYQNRVMIAGIDLDPNTIWFSQNKFDNTNFNTLATEFSASLTIGADPRGGAITAIYPMGINLVIFKESATFVLNGDGPNPMGTGDVFPDPQLVASSVGCNEPQSIVLIPTGIIFKSSKGWYLLDTSFTPQWIGSKVQQYNSLTVTSANIIPNTNQVVFTTDNGPALMYDYYWQKWDVWTNHESQGACIWQDQFCFVKSNGQVYVQNQSIFTDAGSPISMSWTSPDFNFAALSGVQRVFSIFLLGSYKGPHTLNVAIAYDYNQTYTEFTTIDNTASVPIWGTGSGVWGTGTGIWGGTYNIYQFRLDLKNSRCTAVRIQVSDSQASNYNEGYSISAMTFWVGTNGKGNLLPTSAIFGTQ